MMNIVQMIIGGKDDAAASGATFARKNPITGEVVTTAAAASAEDAIAAADAANAAFPAWAALGPNERRGLLLKAADRFEALTGEFIATMTSETGATRPWGGFNVHLATSILREAASLTTQISGEVIPSDRPGCIAMSMRQPVGVVLGIAPWNAPVILGVRSIATPLACGNTVILKASEMCPKTHQLIGEAMRDAGFPDGVVNIVTNAPEDASEVVAKLIEHKAVKRINFTGSTKVGKIIAELSAKELKPVLLELGGKAPFIVLDDADLDQAVAAAGFGAFMNSGQICMSTERIILDDSIADLFVEKFKAKVTTLTAGDPKTNNHPLGSVVDLSAAEHIAKLIKDAVEKGAELYGADEAHGTILSAAMLDHVTPEMRIYGEETFGPITTIVRVSGDDEAVRVANDTEYGLTSAVFTRDTARGLRIAKRIEAGMCHINGPTVHDEAQMPFGGMKASGYGRFGGNAGISEFTELRWITIDTVPGHYPI